MSLPYTSILKWKRCFKATVLRHCLQRFPDSTVKIHIRGTQPQQQPWRQANKKSKSLVILHKSFTGERDSNLFKRWKRHIFICIIVTPRQRGRELQANELWLQQSRILERKIFRRDKIIFLFSSSFLQKAYSPSYVAPIKIFCNLWKLPAGSCKTYCSVETVYRLLCCALEPSLRGEQPCQRAPELHHLWQT